jgi:hypothetical protein
MDRKLVTNGFEHRPQGREAVARRRPSDGDGDVLIRTILRSFLTLSWATPLVIGIGLVAVLAALKADNAKVPFIYNSAR